MRPSLFFLSGLFLALLSFTLFGAISFLAIAAIYTFILYRLFFHLDHTQSFLLLAGFAVGLELWGSAHFGLATAFALAVWLLQHFFALQLRFTSLSLRYIVALLLMYSAYNLTFSPVLPLAGLAHRFFSLLLLSLFTALISLYYRSRSETLPYELL